MVAEPKFNKLLMPIACDLTESRSGDRFKTHKLSDSTELATIPDGNKKDVEYGLTGCVFTKDLNRGHRVAKAIEAGFVWVNHAKPHYLGAPFGGWKQSGNGREEAISKLFEFTQTKNINIKLN